MTDRENKKCRYVHDIAEKICEVALTYEEALEIVNRIKDEITVSMIREKPKALEHPIDRFGRKIALPEMQEADSAT